MAEIKKIIITQRLNAPSSFLIKVADSENEWSDNDDYFIGSEVEILMGYDGSFETILTGEVTGLDCHIKRNEAKEVTIKGNNHLHRLTRCKTNTAFAEMTVKDIISEIADGAGMKADVENLTREHLFTLKNNETDYEYLIRLADYYDCRFWVEEKTLTFKRLEKNMSEDVVLEYGKTLLEFLPVTDTSRIISEVTITSWDPAKQEMITATAACGDIDSKGGSIIDDAFGGAAEIRPDAQVLDQQTADQRAIDVLELNNRDYVTGTGTTYGNPEIKAGAIIKVEGLGEKFSGKYLVTSAQHVLIPLMGYKTSFSFISNLGTPAQSGAGEGAGGAGQTTAAAAGSETQEETEEEQEKQPQFMNLKWMKDGEEITEANVGDDVLLVADTQDLDESTQVNISIWEKDKVGSDDFIKKYNAYVNDNKIEKKWKVEYHEDTDDTESSEEQEKKGYTLPEYMFKIETVNSPDVESDESPVLEVKDWVEIKLVDNDGHPLKNEKYIIFIDDGHTIEGNLDDEGYAKIEGLYMDNYFIVFPDLEESD
jgi:uncharacterized protein